MLTVDLKILDDRLTEAPKYATQGSAGLDVRACIDAPITLEPGQGELLPTGFAMHLANPAYAALLLPRSGLGHKHGIVLGNLTGLIDSDYHGPLTISVWNRSQTHYTIVPMQRYARKNIEQVKQAQYYIVDEFETSERGSGGFGSTGQK